MDQLVASPCSNPEMPLEDVLAAYSEIGFRKFEVFTSWVGSAFDIDADPQGYLGVGGRRGMSFTSLHLPPVTDDLETSIARAVRAAEFARALGVGVVLYKADSRDNYVKAAGAVLDAAERLHLTAVIQNHAGTAISTGEDVRAVLRGVGDERLKALLEVGHFHSVGISWREGCELMAGRIALVHIKDQIGPQSVPFGTGEIDLPGLFEHMRSTGYQGDYVVEMEVTDRENTLRYLTDAVEYIRANCL
ncbi:MAG TPA: sugar phosphate isomerase/epimerase [Phycisphaerae bacterium]|nr:sugar phosphate isomerase/epimerase [Phycisphaerae bacterium]